MTPEDEKVNQIFGYGTKMAIVIRGLRNMFGMSQGELAKSAGSSRPSVARIEAFAERDFRLETLEGLVNVFRKKGVEITIQDDCVNIRLPQSAIFNAWYSIKQSASQKTPLKSNHPPSENQD